jgi:hypothetical protein
MDCSRQLGCAGGLVIGLDDGVCAFSLFPRPGGTG